MSLKSIRESYQKLLKSFSKAGVMFNESQKGDIDNFIMALESTMSDQRTATVSKTRKAVTKGLEKKYRKIFESIMTHMHENARLASKIQDKITECRQRASISKNVSKYLDMYLESVLPKKTIVDYGRLQELENLHESLKDSLLCNDKDVKKKLSKLDGSRQADEKRVRSMKSKLDESQAENSKLKTRLSRYRAVDLLEEKTRDLPLYEANMIKKRFETSSAAEIEKKFDVELGRIHRMMNEEKENAELALEDEIKNILDDEKISDDKSEKTEKKNTAKSAKDVSKDKSDEKSNDEEIDEEEDFETLESVDFDENGDVQLNESEQIGRREIEYWSRLCQEIN